MKLNEVTETGFYVGELDSEREIIYEVINNTDEEWLKETPEQKLLIDEWTYEYTDEDNRKHYEIYGGNLVAVVNAEPFDVIKITDTKYTMDVSDPTIASICNGTAMMEDKPTRLEIAEQQLEAYKMEAEEGKEIHAELKAECERLKQGYAELTEIVSPYMDDFTGYNEELGGFDIVLCIKELMEQFGQLKKECENWESLCRHADKQIDELQAELEALKSFDINIVGIKECEIRQLVQYRKALTEIKEVLQFYSNTTIGVDKGNGIFEFEVSNDNIGKLIYCYDTNPAKAILQKISEVEDGR